MVLTSTMMHNVSFLELYVSKNKGFMLESIYKRHVAAEKLRPQFHFHDRDFKFLVLEKAILDQNPISSLYLDKG